MRLPDRARLAARVAVPLAAAALALVGVLHLLLVAAATARGPVIFDVGPSTGAYGSGFLESEEHPPLTLRWTRTVAAVAVPLDGRGGSGTLTLRWARFLDTPVRVRAFLAGRQVGSFTATPGGFRVERLAIDAPPGPLRLQLFADGPGDEPLGVALDWWRIEGVAWSLAGAGLGPYALVLAVLLTGRLAGLPLRPALGAGLVAVCVVAAWAARDPLACAHVARELAGPALVLGCGAGLALRGHATGRMVALAFLAGYLVKGAGLFAPSYFYGDVRTFSRYARAAALAEGSLAERSLVAQRHANVAYPRVVAGRRYAFPYSPLFFLPFGALAEDRAALERGLKHAALAAAALEVVVTFALARRLLGAAVAARAALLTAFLPPLFGRLLLAMYATVAGHLMDLLMILAAAYSLERPQSLRRFGLLAASLWASLLTYVSSLFTVTAFALPLAALARRGAARLLGAWLLATSATVAILYAPFTAQFVSEILPALVAGARGGSAATDYASGAVGALGRVPMFYGWAYPLLAALGFAVWWRRPRRPTDAVLLSYALAFATLVALRAFGGGLFKDLKEIAFVGPLIAMLAALTLQRWAERGDGARRGADLVTAGLVVFGLARHHADLLRHTGLIDSIGP